MNNQNQRLADYRTNAIARGQGGFGGSFSTKRINYPYDKKANALNQLAAEMKCKLSKLMTQVLAGAASGSRVA